MTDDSILFILAIYVIVGLVVNCLLFRKDKKANEEISKISNIFSRKAQLIIILLILLWPLALLFYSYDKNKSGKHSKQ